MKFSLQSQVRLKVFLFRAAFFIHRIASQKGLGGYLLDILCDVYYIIFPSNHVFSFIKAKLTVLNPQSDSILKTVCLILIYFSVTLSVERRCLKPNNGVKPPKIRKLSVHVAE